MATTAAARCRRNIFSAKEILIVAAATTALFLTTATAFSPEILNQVMVQLQTDEVLFAAANLFDGSMSQSQQKILSLLSTAPGRSKTSSGSIIQFPKLTTESESVYDYETDKSQTISGLLDLTPQEDELIQLICKVRNKYSPSTTVRIAGGWVRDKLLYGKGTPSRDIDFVVSDTSGKEFAEKVCKYLEENSDEDVCIEIPIGNKGKGDHADHLETASLTTSSGFELDFCRLRYERYDKDSRIPTNIGVASAVEDAWRRDLTINSLYYNINTNQVEDWTEQGMRDLILQTVATPRKPLPTLLEDPTRILRAIRFAAQLSFQMSPTLMRAARNEKVRDALLYKVSRDAIGGAIDEMFGTRARDPARGIKLLMATNLIDVVFPLGRQKDIYLSGLEHLSRTQSLVTRIFLASPNSNWDISKRRFLWYAAFFKPIYEMSSLSSTGSNSKRSRRQESPFYQLLDALKRPKADMQSIESILKGADAFDFDAIQSSINSGAHLEDLSLQNSQSNELSELRWTLYSTLKPIGSMWKEAFILALASSQKSLTECVDLYNAFLSLIEDQLRLGTILFDENKFKPLLNGSQIQKALLGEIDGKSFKRIVNAIEEWQIRNSCYDLDTIGSDERNKMQVQLIDYLVATFPEYATSTSTATR